jgi:ATP-dependent Lhr-like helicase
VERERGSGGSGAQRRYSPGGTIEWCDRSLLARIHRYTLNRLRAEIEPVSLADFMRFLFAWQHLEPSARLTGLDGLREALAGLDGFELAAGAWERTVLPARVEGYEPAMLDMLCLSGEIAWMRLSAPAAGPPPLLVPATPIALFLREHRHAWHASRPDGDAGAAPALTHTARQVLALLRDRGACFLSDIASACALDTDALRQAIGALVASGLAASDGFSGLRSLLRAAPAAGSRAQGRFTGRWTATSSPVTSPAASPHDREEAVQMQAWALLRRYGIVFRRLMTREVNAAPWRELTRVFRRFEARGEIRGGRFVSGVSGEQFALPEAVERLREIRRLPANGHLVTIGTADPANLSGIVAPGERLRASTRNKLVYRDGVPLAVLEGDYVRHLAPLDPDTLQQVSRALSRRRTAHIV